MRSFSFLVLISLTGMFGWESAIAVETREADHASAARVVSQNKIRNVSQKIDQLVQQQLRANGIDRNPLADDEIFVRRIYLDAIGRIPTLEETQRFLNSTDEDKRAKLIDDLLDSYGYVSRQFNFWADILRIKSRLRNAVGQPYIDYVKDSLADNKPYDEFVRELLMAEGGMLEEDNGQVGYYLRDYGMPEDNMSNTIRIFLGTRLECAQCHDHPFDKWTQRQYFEMVAFTGGMQFRVDDTGIGRKVRQAVRRQGDELTQQERQMLRRIVQPITTGIAGTGTGLARLPEGFLGTDGDEGDIIPAKTMFDGQALVDPEIPSRINNRFRRRPNNRNQQVIPGARPINSRMVYAEWLTDPENPRFATVIANRLWKQALGVGLIEPVDILDDGTEASNPELMTYLTDTMIDFDFDMKQFLRAIYNSRTYQSQAVSTDVVDVADFHFHGPVVRRMSAEQLWDSLMTLSVPDVDERSTNRDSTRYLQMLGGEDRYDAVEKLKKMSGEEILALVEQMSSGRGAMQNMMMEARRDAQREGRRIRNQVNQLNQQIKRAQRAGHEAQLKKLTIERAELVAEFKKYSRGGNAFRRASELPSPAPVGHFLREFGQSDREQIENSNADPAVTQVLSLMNGFIESQVSSNPNTMLVTNIVKAETPGDKVNAAFLTMLSRKAKSHELSVWKRDFEGQGFPALSDLVWVIANSNEFIFVK